MTVLTIPQRQEMIALSEWHREQDLICKGDYGHLNGKYSGGCSIGCTLHSAIKIGVIPRNTYCGSHSVVAELWDLPLQLPYLFDSIFEGLPDPLHLDWTTRWQKAIKFGADHSLVWPKLAVWLLIDETHGVRRFVADEKWKLQRDAIDQVASLWQRVIGGETRDSLDKEFSAARSAARSAAYSAARSAARSAAYSAARSAHWQAIADKLIELLQTA